VRSVFLGSRKDSGTATARYVLGLTRRRRVRSVFLGSRKDSGAATERNGLGLTRRRGGRRVLGACNDS